jgi:hypothetical protein
MGGETKSFHRILIKEVSGLVALEDLEPEETIKDWYS